MQRSKANIATTRANTNASLGAERADTDSARMLKTVRAQRVQDDHLERDRLMADERLWKYRARADSLLARERTASPALDRAVGTERHVADESKQIERQVTDAHLERERRRSDRVAAKEREAHEDERAALNARRHDTDHQLSTERDGTDAALASTTTALADSQGVEERQRDLLGMVAHDLRSPLCVIAMSAQMISETTAEASTREEAEEVRRAAARMERLLADLIDAARIEQRTLHVVKTPHDVGTFVTEVFRSYRQLFAAREIAFSVEVPASAVIASFDHDRIVQVLSNLLGNALKFTPAKEGVGLRAEPHGQEIEFEVRDSGPGIRPSDLPHVFKRFWQIDSESRRGLGLGLHICETIVLAHGGRIWVESEFGNGATFRFTLPLGSASSPSIHGPAADHES
jgi:signal transduction histidine kinase